MASSAPFAEGDVVLAWHQGNLFEAKIVSATVTPDGERAFTIHYKGWAEKWNETVGFNRLLVDNQLNRQLQRENRLRRSRAGRSGGAGNAGGAGAGGASGAGNSGGGSGGARRGELTDGQLPDSLLQRLADDWERVSTRRYLVHLPVPATQRSVRDILLAFREEHKEHAGMADDVFRLFNVGLGSQLLYRLERKQFLELFSRCSAAHSSEDPAEQLARLQAAPLVRPTLPVRSSKRVAAGGSGPGAAPPAGGGVQADTSGGGSSEDETGEITPADLYGAEHLLRLLARLPHLMWEAKEDEPSRTATAAMINSFGTYIERAQMNSGGGEAAKMRSMWSAYEPASPQYCREALSGTS